MATVACSCSCCSLGCAFSWPVFDRIVRALSFLTHLGLVAASCWGYLICIHLFRERRDMGGALTSVNLAVFVGLMATYNATFGVLGALAEFRLQRLRKGLLRPFGFLHTHVGRGVFMCYVGTIFALLPWDEERPYVAKIPGAFEIGMGLMQIVVGTCAPRSLVGRLNTAAGAGGGGDGGGGDGGAAGGGDTRSAAARIFEDGDDADEVEEAGKAAAAARASAAADTGEERGVAASPTVRSISGKGRFSGGDAGDDDRRTVFNPLHRTAVGAEGFTGDARGAPAVSLTRSPSSFGAGEDPGMQAVDFGGGGGAGAKAGGNPFK